MNYWWTNDNDTYYDIVFQREDHNIDAVLYTPYVDNIYQDI